MLISYRVSPQKGKLTIEIIYCLNLNTIYTVQGESKIFKFAIPVVVIA